MSNFINITGKRFGRLTAIKFIERVGRAYYWLFKCDCGNDKIIRKDIVKRGDSKSCGCFLAESTRIRSLKHGMHNSRFYNTWFNIKRRCLNQNNPRYNDYGGRGIKLCDSWLRFENFRDDMYRTYLDHIKKFGEKNTSIDRRNNDGNYNKKNCKWAGREEQDNNKRVSHFIIYNKKKLTLTQWGKSINLSPSTIKYRLETLNWSVEKTLTTPSLRLYDNKK